MNYSQSKAAIEFLMCRAHNPEVAEWKCNVCAFDRNHSIRTCCDSVSGDQHDDLCPHFDTPKQGTHVPEQKLTPNGPTHGGFTVFTDDTQGRAPAARGESKPKPKHGDIRSDWVYLDGRDEHGDQVAAAGWYEIGGLVSNDPEPEPTTVKGPIFDGIRFGSVHAFGPQVAKVDGGTVFFQTTVRFEPDRAISATAGDGETEHDPDDYGF
jgi:hypothetical protein